MSTEETTKLRGKSTKTDNIQTKKSEISPLKGPVLDASSKEIPENPIKSPFKFLAMILHFSAPEGYQGIFLCWIQMNMNTLKGPENYNLKDSEVDLFLS